MSELSIAFFVEPVPIRGDLEYGRLPFDIVKTAADAISVAGLATTHVIAKDYFIETCLGAFEKVAASTLGFNQRFTRKWEANWIGSAAKINRRIAKKLENFFIENKINVVFIVDKHDTARYAATKAGVKIVHIAQGPIRSRSSRYWLFDPSGIGPDSFLHSSVHYDGMSHAASTHALQTILDSVVPVLTRQISARRRVLIALQPDDDFSGLVWNPELKVSTILELVKVASVEFAELDFVVRRHPSDKRDYTEFFSSGEPNIFYDDGGQDIWQTLGSFSAVINVCSTIATEATLAGIRVLTLGRSLLAEGCDLTSLNEAIRTFLSTLGCPNSLGAVEIDKIAYAIDHFLVEEAIAHLPTIYFLLAKELSQAADTSAWFDDGNLREICRELNLGSLWSDLGRLKAENHNRSLDFRALYSNAERDQKHISQLLTHNHFRIQEVQELRERIDDLQKALEHLR